MITRLRELRESNGYSQLRVAMDLNLNQNSVSRYEQGLREAGYDLLVQFADYDQVSVDYILRKTDNPKMNA